MRTVLVVDDVQTNRLILRRILGSDYIVLEAQDGSEAIAVLDRQYRSISAVLLDIIMPVTDGFEVLRHIQSRPMLSQIPVIVTTGNTEKEAEKKALALGATDFVTKPYDADIIKRRLDNHVRFRETAAMVNTLQKDRLTGLWNRETFFDKAAWDISKKPDGFYVLSSVDIDNFKIVNDQYGTKKGDEVLMRIAGIVQAYCDQHGGLCGRINADNFVVLYPRTLMESSDIKERTMAASAVEGLPLPISISAGRYIVNDRHLSVSAMYDRACIAQETVKGRYDVHVAVYNESMRSHLLREQEIVGSMNEALENNQFEAWYQPQYNHATGALVGAEALARWRHPVRGLISPGEFVPVFERNGFVYELDKYIWEQVAKNLRAWMDEGRSPLPVSVNISRYDLFCEDLVCVLCGLVEKYRIPVELLRLEITESAFAKSTEQVIAVAKQLIDSGFTLEIDDFGSGYSSLNTLKDVPAQVLKLDMRFFEGDDNSARGGNIIESVVRMSKWLGMSVIAEGVETLEKADFLRSIGCNYVQGYLYAKPMPQKDYEMLAKGVVKEEKLIALETVENLDNNEFWRPESMDTLIFNSYVGAACIFEYHGGGIELLRTTEKYTEMLGRIGMSMEDALRLDWASYFDAGDRARVAENLQKSIREKTDVTDEYVFRNLPGCPRELYMRSALRVIASTGDRYLVYCTNENVTAQREAERNERRIAERMQAIMDHVGSGITATVKNGKSITYLVANDRYYNIIGYTREQYEREVDDVHTLLNYEDCERVERATLDAALSGETQTVEYRVTRRDGREIWLRNVISMTRFDGLDRPVQLTIHTDITREKTAAELLRNTDEQLHIIMDNIEDGICASVVDEGVSHAIFANKQYYAMFGYSKAEFERDLPNGVLDLVHPDDLARTRRLLRINEEQQGTAIIAFRAILRDGSVIWVRASDTVCRIAGIDGPVHITVHTNTTAERQAAERLHNSEEQLRTILRSMDGGVAAVTVQNGVRRYIFANDNYYGMFGYTREQFLKELPNGILDLVHPDDLERIRGDMAMNEASERTNTSECCVYRRDRSLMHIRIIASVSRMDGIDTPVHIAVIYDVTREKEMLGQIRSLNNNLADLMNDTPGGFARLRVMPGGIATEYVNKPFCRLRGMSVAEIMAADSEDAMDTVHPADREMAKKTIAEMIATGIPCSTQYRLRRGDGSYVPLNVFARLTKNEAGDIHINAYYTALSEEESSALSEIRMLPLALTAMMEESQNIVFVKDLELRYVRGNQFMAEACGRREPKEILGRTDAELIDSASAEVFRKIDLEILRTGKPLLNHKTVLQMEDGSFRYERTSKYPLTDAAGHVIGIFGIGQDITSDQTAFEQLKLLTDSIPGGIATFEVLPEGMQIRYFNDGFYNFSGYTREEYGALIGASPTALVFPEDVISVSNAFDAIRNGADEAECQYRCRCKDNSFRWFRMRCAVQMRRAERILVGSVRYDITSEKAADEALRIHEEEYRLAIADSDKHIYRYLHAEGIIEIPENTARLFSLPPTIGNVPESILELGDIAPESMASYRAFYAAVKNGDKNGEMTVKRRIEGGEWRWFSARFSTVFDDGGSPVSSIIVFEDITEERAEHVSDALNRSRFVTALGTVYPVIISVNLTEDSYEVVSSFGSMLMLEKRHGKIHEMVDSTAKRMPKDYAENFRKQFSLSNLLQAFSEVGDSLKLEYQQNTPDGKKRWMEITVIRTQNEYNNDITGVVVGRYIDVQKTIEDRLKLAEIDRMTGLLNKVTTEEQIKKRLAESNGEPCALLVADLDCLKNINDTMGHDQGDLAIKKMASLLRGQFRQSDIVGRIGGDEFAVFISGITESRINSTLVAFMRKISAVRLGQNEDYKLSGSIGVALGTSGEDSYEEMFKRADRALYHVKRNGKDDFAFYAPGMEEEAYRYETQSHSSKWQGNQLDVDELDCLLSAISAVYPMVISVNLTQNSYYMLQYDNYMTHNATNAGTFDELIETGVKTFHPDDRESFLACFARENLINAHARGETIVRHRGRQLGDDGKYRHIRTDVIFVKNKNSDDILEITLARESEEE